MQNYHPNSVILHIPHSSSHIPDYQNYVSTTTLEKEINRITDWATEKIFDIQSVDSIVVPFSRLFCDVERLPDDIEPMFQKGMGFYYTHTSSGIDLRKDDPLYKAHIWNEYHQKHHESLLKKVDQKLHLYEKTLIIDCHSFSSTPLPCETQQSPDRPDICIGSEEIHTPKALEKHFEDSFRAQGFSVKINMPYSGSIVPLVHLGKSQNVHSIMIEINKKLYMNEKTFVIDQHKVESLQSLIQSLVRSVSSG